MIRDRRRPVALLAAAVLGAVAALSLRGGAAAPAAPPAPAVSVGSVVATDLRTTELTAGTLGYAPAAPVVNQLSGTYTQLPRPGTTIQRGGTLYRVDNAPVTLMTGSTPAWRTFAAGMTDGPDISELQANLIALGDANGLFSEPTGHYDWLTATAVERWQLAEHEPVSGDLALGTVIFAPTPMRVGAWTLAPAETASPGQLPYDATTATRTVTVALNPNLPATHVGEPVSIILPSGSTTPGTITSIAAALPHPGASSAAGGAAQSPQLTVTPKRPAVTGTGTGVDVQVSLTTSYAHRVLAAPVSALLALAGGGYGLEVVTPSGTHRLVSVRTGTFAGSLVQVSGSSIGAGTRVVVAQ